MSDKGKNFVEMEDVESGGSGESKEEKELKKKIETTEKSLKYYKLEEQKRSFCLVVVVGFLWLCFWAALSCAYFFPTYNKRLIYYTVVRDNCFLLRPLNITSVFTTGVANCNDCRVCGLVSCSSLIARNQTGDCCGEKCDDDEDTYRLFCVAQYGSSYALSAIIGVGSAGTVYNHRVSSFVDYAPIARDARILEKGIFDCWHYYGNHKQVYLEDGKISEDTKEKNYALVLAIVVIGFFSSWAVLLLFAAIYACFEAHCFKKE